MKPVKLSKINHAKRVQIEELIRLCCDAEPIRLSIPLPAADEPLSDESFFVLYDCDRLISLVHLFYPDHAVGELIGFTHPEHRGQGCFRRLLDEAADHADEIGLDQVYVISDGNSANAVHALKELGLETEYTEYMLEKSLIPADDPDSFCACATAHDSGLSVSEIVASTETATLFSDIFQTDLVECESYLEEVSSDDRIHTYVLTLENQLIGQAQITLMGDLAYLSGFGILPGYRRQGFGSKFLQLLEKALISQSIAKLTLQVSDKNKPALSLYRKDGFDVLEALHYSPLFEEE